MACSEENIAVGRSSSKDREFDNVVGHIEDIMIGGELNELQDNFMERIYRDFDDNEENKLIYMDHYNEYVSLVEKYLESELNNRINGFSMKAFLQAMSTRRNEVSDDLMELLLSFTDFLIFKQLVLDYKKSQETGNDEATDSWLSIKPCFGPGP